MAATDNAQCSKCLKWSVICLQDGSGSDPAAGTYKWTCPKCDKSTTWTYVGAGTHADFCDEN